MNEKNVPNGSGTKPSGPGAGARGNGRPIMNPTRGAPGHKLRETAGWVASYFSPDAENHVRVTCSKLDKVSRCNIMRPNEGNLGLNLSTINQFRVNVEFAG